MILKIISGGQTGADRGGLDAALHCETPHGGWCPKGRKAENGSIPLTYNLAEMQSAEYLARTKANVVDSDATVIFIYGPLSGGSLKTATYAHHSEKPYHDVDLKVTNRKKAVEELVRWLAGDAELNDYDEYLTTPPPLSCILKVAGCRESRALGIQEAVFHLMVDVLIAVNPACHMFYGLGRPNKGQNLKDKGKNFNGGTPRVTDSMEC